MTYTYPTQKQVDDAVAACRELREKDPFPTCSAMPTEEDFKQVLNELAKTFGRKNTPFFSQKLDSLEAGS